MLENLNETLCVSKHLGKSQSFWSCYEPLAVQRPSKRQVWKRLTGLLSTSEMQVYLSRNHHSLCVCEKFKAISS